MKFKKNKQPAQDYSRVWESWLSDDPLPPELESRISAPYVPPPDDSPMFSPSANQSALPADPVATNITINVSMPKIKVPEIKKDHLTKLKAVPRTTAGGLAILAVVMIFAGWATHGLVTNPAPKAANPVAANPTQVLGVSNTNINSSGNILNPSTQTTQPKLSTGTPSTATAKAKAGFKPVAPADKPELGNYAFAKTSYNEDQGTYTYVDVIGGKVFSVTEQQIPTTYKSAQEAVSKVASTIGAKQFINTPSGAGYMLSDTESGKQTVVFSVNKLLLAINSNFTHSAADWENYIAALR